MRVFGPQFTWHDWTCALYSVGSSPTGAPESGWIQIRSPGRAFRVPVWTDVFEWTTETVDLRFVRDQARCQALELFITLLALI